MADQPLGARILEAISTDNSTMTAEMEQTAIRIAKWMQVGQEDATWVLTSGFMILTMQSGFGALESGSISRKFEVNVMMKNVIDVIAGGLAYWLVGYGLSFGRTFGGLVGTTNFCINAAPSIHEAAMELVHQELYSHYIFQLTFASAATTIVSGSVAGRMKLGTYTIFSFLNVIIYCFPCHWVWASEGWLLQWGFYDFAGDGPVHLVGGVTGLIGAILLGPREGRFDPARANEFMLQNPVVCILGLFMLWWGWLGFNCGSTFGITGFKWMVATRSAVTTINSSIGGGIFGVIWSRYWQHPGIFYVADIISGVLAGLVSITAGCAAVLPAESLFIGAFGAFLALVANDLLLRVRIDDPVGAVGIHAVAAAWGLLAVGLFAHAGLEGGPTLPGLLHGGGWELLGIQVVGCCSIALWTTLASFPTLLILNRIMGLRGSSKDEKLGFDFVEHGIEPEVDVPALLSLVEEMRAELLETRRAFKDLQAEVTASRPLTANQAEFVSQCSIVATTSKVRRAGTGCTSGSFGEAASVIRPEPSVPPEPIVIEPHDEIPSCFFLCQGQP